jgi:hypothetical protein
MEIVKYPILTGICLTDSTYDGEKIEPVSFSRREKGVVKKRKAEYMFQ